MNNWTTISTDSSTERI